MPVFPRSSTYDGFISYSHALDGRLAPALQHGLEHFAKPWYQIRALRIFRDTTNLSANPGLWSSIELALASSGWLVLMASPGAARSKWVDLELEWWLRNRSADRVLIVLTEGDLIWDERTGRLKREKTTALPPVLRDALSVEPRWVDLRWLHDADQVAQSNPRLRECVADVAATLRGVPKDALVGEHIRQHRRTMRLASSAVTALVLLLVAALVAALVAVTQRNDALNNARIATARQLAATSLTLTHTNLHLARLLAVQGFRMDPNPQTRSALLRAVTASPFLVRYLWADERLSVIAGAANGKVAVAGTEHGRILRWDIRTGARLEVARLPKKVASISTSADGNTLAAVDGTSAVLWTQHHQVRPLAVPPGLTADLTAVSPSGHLIAVAGHAGGDGEPVTSSALTLLGLQPRGSLSPRSDSSLRYQVEDLVIPKETELVLAGRRTDGAAWERRSLPNLAQVASGRVWTGAHNLLHAISPSGRFISYDYGGSDYGANRVPLWRTTEPTSDQPPDLFVRMPGTNPEAVALSDDGRRTAIADTGTIYVSDTAPGTGAIYVPDTRGNSPPQTEAPSAKLTGSSSINYETGLQFFADSNHLLSASGASLAVWDLTQLSPIGQRMRMTVPPSCHACEGPKITVRPDGRAVASSSDGYSIVVREFDSQAETVIERITWPPPYGPPVWSADSKKLLLVTQDDGGGQTFEVRSADRGAPLLNRWESSPKAGGTTEAATISGDGRRVVAVGSNGESVIRDASTGEVERVVRAPSGIKGVEQGDHVAAVNGDASAVALVGAGDNAGEGIAKLVNLRTGVSRTIGGSPARGVALSSKNLLVQRSSGALEVWDAKGSHLQRSIPGEGNYSVGPAVNPEGTLVARMRPDGTVVITDLESGEQVGSFNLAVPSKVGIAFAPDGQTLITVTQSAADDAVGSNGEVQRWNLSEDAWVQTACAGRDLTAMEWQRYVGSSPPSNLRCG